jgi:hypothetical protein
MRDLLPNLNGYLPSDAAPKTLQSSKTRSL